MAQGKKPQHLFCAGCSYGEGSEHCKTCILKEKFMKEEQRTLSRKAKNKMILNFVIAAFFFLFAGLALYVTITGSADLAQETLGYRLGAHSTEIIFGGLAIFFLVKGIRISGRKMLRVSPLVTEKPEPENTEKSATNDEED